MDNRLEKSTYCFDRVRNDISEDCNFLRLPDAIHSINGLCLYHRVPMRFYQMHNTGRCKVNPKQRCS